MQPTLSRTLASLAAAGWENPLVFAEPGVEPIAGCQWRPSDRQLGGWPNFIRAAKALAEIECDAVMLVQDDVVFCRGVRDYLESITWPEGAAALSIYSPKCYTNQRKKQKRGFHRIQSRSLIGALTYVLKPEKLRRLAASEFADSLRSKGIDTLFGRWAIREGGAWYHNPSLAMHIGDTSTLHPGVGNRRNRQAGNFVGEEFDARTWIPAAAITAAASP